MKIYGFPWPQMLSCSRYEDNDMCIQPVNSMKRELNINGTVLYSTATVCQHCGATTATRWVARNSSEIRLQSKKGRKKAPPWILIAWEICRAIFGSLSGRVGSLLTFTVLEVSTFCDTRRPARTPPLVEFRCRISDGGQMKAPGLSAGSWTIQRRVAPPEQGTCVLAQRFVGSISYILNVQLS